jgi:hypothetical protein
MTAPISTRKAHEAISRREAFVSHGALSARQHTGPGDELNFGKMSEGSVASIKHLQDIDYVVHSYATPIGVHSASAGWVIPDDKYSNTTSRHQGILRRGASTQGE